jgi:putative tryptophan/tyrosine transport system substrate-binding protein
MRRREVIAGIAIVPAALSARATAQPAERFRRRIGVLVSAPAGDPEYVSNLTAFRHRLEELGWSEDRNLRIDLRWGGQGPAHVHGNAVELVGLVPNVIVAPGSTSAGAALQATRSIPIVFMIVPDPVGAGFVESLSRPGGNATGFASFDYSIGGKWVELLKEVTPNLKRVGVVRDPDITAGIGQWSVIQAVAPLMGLEPRPINVRLGSDVEQAIPALAQARDAALIITSGAGPFRHRDLIVRLAAEHKLPAAYYAKTFVTSGGLMSFGADRTDQFRRAAEYAHRILNGESPADLPVQSPAKYELVLNLKTAKALGVAIPSTLLARADEVIE